ncbi:MAG: 6-phosphogluconolactonase [Candidatus Peregrinibacteria bacterium Greene0416_19]|nr:MAG: 6-phosphogluconolactonase [Candidatus Peregrinibacteria bacterium Greene0416_19]
MPDTRWIDTADDAAFTIEALSHLQTAIHRGIADDGRCILGFSGGSTPGPVYRALGKADGIRWDKVWIFLVDERYTDATSPDSNQFLVRSALTDHTDIPEDHLLFPDTSLPIDDCIRAYDERLFTMLTSLHPDLVVLGMGEDGHIASLFPPVKEEAWGKTLAIRSRTDRFVVPDRVSVTFPVLTATSQSLFLLRGKPKIRVWDEMTASRDGPERWPAKEIVQRTSTTVITCGS